LRLIKPLKNYPNVLPKSRYESVSRYLSPGPNYSGLCKQLPNYELESPGQNYFKHEYNDLPEIMNQDVYRQLLDGGVDDLLAKHYSHLFIRDPLVIFKELLHLDDAASSDHFENIQSTNWQSMRFKPPSAGSDIGWRVEFRTMDVQFTDYENAAFSNFIVLLVRTICAFNLNLYIPLSKVDENMQIGQMRNAVLSKKFWFRKCILSGIKSLIIEDYNKYSNIHDEYQLFTIDQIMTGTEEMPGICNLIDQYLDQEPISQATRSVLKSQVNLIRERANGTRKTNAAWIREFVMNHPGYKHDSVITPEMNYDLCEKILHIKPNELLK
jgi:glutamate--cysteine ligase catalytic subunit